MAGSYFSVPIFFIIFRKSLHSPSRHIRIRIDRTGETVEGAIIVSVLLSFVEQLMTTGKLSTASSISNTNGSHAELDADRDREYSETNPLLRRDEVRNETGPLAGPEAEERMQKLVSRMKIQIWAGMGVGMLIASGIGAAFIAVVCPLCFCTMSAY
jgi:high-affinity iron transporter